MLIECPHCYSNVLPDSKNICPACRKDINDLAGADLSRKEVEIKIGEKLPYVCYKCGKKAESFINQNQSINESKTNGVFKFLLYFISPLLAFAGDSNKKKSVKLQIKMPVCKSCKGIEILKPRYVDLNNFRVSYIVHSNFREALYETRKIDA